MDTAVRAVEVKTKDGVADCGLCVPVGEGRWPAVLVWPDIHGLRPTFEEMARRLAAQGYAVLVPNPFYRMKRAPMPDWKVDFSTADGRERAMALVHSLTSERVLTDAQAMFAFLDAQPEVDTAKKAGAQGYCMGGAMAMRTAAAVPERVGAVASFHGGGLVTPAPDSPHRLVSTIKAEALVAVATDDDQKDPGARPALEEAFAQAGLKARVELFAGANHGWCVPDSPSHNLQAAERAWAELEQLYRRTLM